jgi:putative tryptophan/tyrosine transport system substrate-binding protein
MRRRDLLGGALFWASTAVAQQRSRIAILHSGFPHRTPIEQLYAALRDLGHEHGRTAEIELLGAEGDPGRLTSFVAKLVQEHPQVIIAVTSPAALALKRANVTTPVVFLFVSDPIRLGLIESLPRPGGNYTGVTFSDAFLGAKRLELLADTVPGIRTVAVLWSPQFEENAALVESIRNAGNRLAIEVATKSRLAPEQLLLRRMRQVNEQRRRSLSWPLR